MDKFLRETKYVDFSNPLIREKTEELFNEVDSDTEKARIAYEFVRDEIPHTFDINSAIITAKASDVLKYRTGICHAKSNLLAALLRSQNIPTGFCFEHLCLAEDESLGYCVHAFNAAFLEGKWVQLDARGNKKGVCAEFSLGKPILAYPPRIGFDEYFFEGIYADTHIETMKMLESAKTLDDIIENIPEFVTKKADIIL